MGRPSNVVIANVTAQFNMRAAPLGSQALVNQPFLAGLVTPVGFSSAAILVGVGASAPAVRDPLP